MVEIIVTGHGCFPEGILSSMRLIAGEQPNVHGVNFEETDNTEMLREKLMETMAFNDKLLVLTDIAGGTPYNTAVMLQAEHLGKEMQIVSGTNLPMLLSAVFNEEQDVKALAEAISEEARDGVNVFEWKPSAHKAEEEEEDGI